MLIINARYDSVSIRAVLMPMRPYTFPLLTSILAAACIATTAPAEKPLDEAWQSKLIELVLERVRSVPDCKFKYTVDFKMGETKRILRRLEFCKSGDCYYFKQYSETGDLERHLSYDGKTYFNLVNDGNLYLGSDFTHFQKPITAEFANNPLFSGAYQFFKGGRSHRFALPFLHSPETWAEAVKGMRLQSNAQEPNPQNQTLILEDAKSKLTIELPQNVFPGLVERALAGNEYKTQWKILKTDTIRPTLTGVKDFTVNSEIFETTVFLDGTPFPGGSTRIVMDVSSLELLAKPLSVQHFRIPISAARSVRDNDLGTVIKSSK